MMRDQNAYPNVHTFAGIFTAVLGLRDLLSVGKQAQSAAVKIGGFADVFVGTSLLNMYCKLGLVLVARKVFDRMPVRNSVSWAAMISGYAVQRDSGQAMGLFRLLMGVEKEGVNEFVLTSVLSAFTLPEFIDNGKQIHCYAIKNGVLSVVSVGNAVVAMYGKCGRLDDSVQVELLSNKNAITWSVMITVHTLVGVLNACSDISAAGEGKQPMLGRVFDYLQEPDIVLWTSVIGGYVQNGENEDALILYGKMQMAGILPNELTMASVLKACSSLAALEQGKQIHARVVRYGFGLEVPIGSVLSTMYAKCGSLEDGNVVFKRMPVRDVVAWNSMIAGLSQNGIGNEALDLFEEMRSEGTKSDYVTFVNILLTCNQMGLVERGWGYFNMMSNEFAQDFDVITLKNGSFINSDCDTAAIDRHLSLGGDEYIVGS
ncbi:tetratricopeptide repeat (TPR)-like superfamily protein [Actinidia rufa]|uniref:Tetratricopeptide repeat (TPR)-like superfamily protein n=1 Tax=Actinidia rufa TaxID=165716 RepID=A0A7J0DZQ0_9ERIC|nr:tetratricopeptide repeat (TPR)-like superfamily protein [Actinidia rufa]